MAALQFDTEIDMVRHEKAAQVQALLRETGLDCWLIFVRETGIHPDPGFDLLVGAHVVRNSAFVFNSRGHSVAIVAEFDAEEIGRERIFGEVIGYHEDIRPALLGFLGRFPPRSIGLNYSLDDVTADGLTHGHWLLLQDMFRDTPYLDRLTSAAPLLAKLRGRKTRGELKLITKAVEHTEEIVAGLSAHIRPGVSERQLADIVHAEFRRRGLDPAWDWAGCPIVNCGPCSVPGHCRPREDLVVTQGELVHIDLGVKVEGYCSDLQRMWYVRREGESDLPDEVRRAFEVVVQAIEAGASMLRPGTRGCDVDAAARKVVIDAGYPEFKHALGHGVGRAVHDGGTLLGPRWPCYGRTVEGIVEAGNVFTLELGVMTSAGFVGLEEDVLVTDDGCRFLSTFQRAPVLV